MAYRPAKAKHEEQPKPPARKTSHISVLMEPGNWAPAGPGNTPYFSSEKALMEQAIQYFNTCDINDIRYTVPGLALYLGFSTRFGLYKYKEKPKFSHVINRVMLAIETQRVEALVRDDCKNSRGLEFDLTHSFGYKAETAITPPSNAPQGFYVQLNYFLDKQGLKPLPVPTDSATDAEYTQPALSDVE